MLGESRRLCTAVVTPGPASGHTKCRSDCEESARQRETEASRNTLCHTNTCMNIVYPLDTYGVAPQPLKLPTCIHSCSVEDVPVVPQAVLVTLSCHELVSGGRYVVQLPGSAASTHKRPGSTQRLLLLSRQQHEKQVGRRASGPFWRGSSTRCTVFGACVVNFQSLKNACRVKSQMHYSTLASTWPWV